MDDKQYSQPPPAYTFSSGEVPPPPGYTQQYEPPHGKTEQGFKKCPPDTVIQTQPYLILQPPPMGPQPRSYLFLGIFTTICCNFVFGLLAVWMGYRSQRSSDRGDYVTAKKNGRCSLAFSIVSILLGLVTLAAVVCFYLYRAGIFEKFDD